MSRHLSSQQVSEAILGQCGADVEGHLRECSTCSGKVHRLASDLSVFGSVVRSWGDHASAPVTLTVAAQRGTFSFPKLFSAGAAFAAILIVGLLLEVHDSRPHEAMRRPEVSDAVLMQQVNSELSRSVPGPMEPLENLMGAQ
jgi:hypothetical protein